MEENDEETKVMFCHGIFQTKGNVGAFTIDGATPDFVHVSVDRFEGRGANPFLRHRLSTHRRNGEGSPATVEKPTIKASVHKPSTSQSSQRIQQTKPILRMMTKCLILLAALVAVCSGGAVPLAVPAPVPAALTVGTFASSYNAHAINHAIAAPYVAPAVAAAPYVAPAVAAAPFAAAPLAAAPLAYSAYPAINAYSAPLFAGRR
ncbi:uncharacterized protein LOC107218823 [Neodiprion lecontei]|uniref:Uncharacterized protein LOC107218823 n=2 Tax=Neodiprion TaxID=270857 RepID=A0A6J0BDA8_NEOLC|nr:uncharacterized protein LOC107218823 [Neodiprion lecontei]